MNNLYGDRVYKFKINIEDGEVVFVIGFGMEISGGVVGGVVLVVGVVVVVGIVGIIGIVVVIGSISSSFGFIVIVGFFGGVGIGGGVGGSVIGVGSSG